MHFDGVHVVFFSSRSKVIKGVKRSIEIFWKLKIHVKVPIELKFTGNVPYNILRTMQVQLTPFITQGSRLSRQGVTSGIKRNGNFIS